MLNLKIVLFSNFSWIFFFKSSFWSFAAFNWTPRSCAVLKHNESRWDHSKKMALILLGTVGFALPIPGCVRRPVDWAYFAQLVDFLKKILKTIKSPAESYILNYLSNLLTNSAFSETRCSLEIFNWFSRSYFKFSIDWEPVWMLWLRMKLTLHLSFCVFNSFLRASDSTLLSSDLEAISWAFLSSSFFL